MPVGTQDTIYLRGLHTIQLTLVSREKLMSALLNVKTSYGREPYK